MNIISLYCKCYGNALALAHTCNATCSSPHFTPHKKSLLNTHAHDFKAVPVDLHNACVCNMQQSRYWSWIPYTAATVTGVPYLYVNFFVRLVSCVPDFTGCALLCKTHKFFFLSTHTSEIASLWDKGSSKEKKTMFNIGLAAFEWNSEVVATVTESCRLSNLSYHIRAWLSEIFHRSHALLTFNPKWWCWQHKQHRWFLTEHLSL